MTFIKYGGIGWEASSAATWPRSIVFNSSLERPTALVLEYKAGCAFPPTPYLTVQPGWSARSPGLPCDRAARECLRYRIESSSAAPARYPSRTPSGRACRAGQYAREKQKYSMRKTRDTYGRPIDSSISGRNIPLFPISMSLPRPLSTVKS